MLGYAQASEGEISGFCKTAVTKVAGDFNVEVTDIKIFTQNVSDSFTRLTTNELTAHFIDLYRAKEDTTKWNLWWHSHAGGMVFFSSIDVPTIEQVSKNAALFSICINKHGEVTARYDYKGKFITEATVNIDYPINKRIKAICAKEVAEKVTYKPFIFSKLEKGLKYECKNYVHPTRRNTASK
jgi:proteasome lid subunit RPN8/RPN11